MSCDSLRHASMVIRLYFMGSYPEKFRTTNNYQFAKSLGKKQRGLTLASMLGKSSLYILLPVLCILSFILVLVCLWLLCRRAKKGQSITQKQVKAERAVVHPDFTIPISLRTVAEQLPVVTYERENLGDSTDVGKTGNRGRRGAVGIKNDLKEWNKGGQRRSSHLGVGSASDLEHRSNIGSISSAEIDDTLKSAFEGELLPVRGTSAKERQRRISLAMIHGFREEGRKVSLSKPLQLFDGGEKSEALAAALEAAEIESMQPSMRVSELDTEDDNETVSADRSEPMFVRKRMAARRGKDKKKSVKTGHLCFTTQYFSDKKQLEIMVIRAFDLKKPEESDELSPFLRLYLLPGKRQKQHTRVKRKTKEPYFNEKRIFYDLSSTDFVSKRLKLKVYSRETITRNVLLGETEVALSSLSLTEKQSFSVDLFLTKDELTAQIMVSLFHNAAISQLEVSIHKARRLPNLSKFRSPDTYCRLYLFREDGRDKCETKIKRSSRQPVWDEKHTFKVATSSSNPLQVLSLAISLISCNIVGKNDVIGHVIFSLDSSESSAVQDWKQLNDCPHVSITNWYTLTEPDDL